MNLDFPERPVGGLSVRRPQGVELRPLARADFDVAFQMMRELYALPRATDADRERNRERYEALIGDVDAVPFLAIADDEPAGIVIFRFRRRLNFATYQGWISDLYVRAAARGRGIGRLLVRACIEESRLRGARALTLETGYDNVAARGLYAALGFREAGTHFQQRPPRVRGIRPPDGVTLRPMAAEDFEAVTRLLAELGRPAPEPERMAAVERTFTEHLRRGSTASLVATREDRIVGVCTLELREPFFILAPQAWIAELVVTEPARGGGIGAALLDAALAEAAHRGAYAAVLESGSQRAVAHSLYATAGFEDVGSFFVLDRP